MAWQACVASFMPRPADTEFPTPGALAKFLDPTTKQTAALDLIDAALVDVAEGRCKRLMIALPPQEGKALALDTPIATPDGWTTMGALSVGDEVFDRHGKPCRVTWTSPTWTNRPCYIVRTGDGEAIVADARHDWPARLDRTSSERLVTSELLAKPRSKNAQITGSSGLNLPDAVLPLDPYVLGAWLGDGHTNAAAITSADIEIVERIRSAGVPCRKGRAEYAWSLAPAGTTACSPIRKALVELGVWGNKHVPAIYHRASRAQRLALLQGLVDTDGYVDPRGQVEFCATNKRLADDVRELVFSLGAKASTREGRATIAGKDCGPKYRVRFFMANAAWLPRKAAKCTDSSVARVRYTWAEQTESVPTRCIEVDSLDHTFLAGRSLLPTHNSQRTSRRFPLWMLRRNPDLRIAIVSYAHSIARRWGRAIRDDINDHGKTLNLTINPSSAAAHEWELLGHAGSVYCVGLRGSLTSRPVDLLIIDDPYKDGEQADSEAWQETVEDFWTEVAIPRLGPGVAVVIIQTRWRDDDLSGWLQKRNDGIDWRVINIPAQADHDPAKGETDPLGREPGEYLVSTRDRTPADWDEKKREVGSRSWNALYQGRPSPAGGNIFNREWWQSYESPQWIERPDGTRWAVGFDEICISWDMAFKDLDSSDWVVGQVWGRRGVEAFLLDQVRGRFSFVNTCTEVRTLAARWPQAIAKYVEDKANGTAVMNQLRRIVAGLIGVEPEGSKVARARAVSPFVEAGNVFLPAPEIAPWIGDFIEEHASFPNGSNDDQVDTSSQALNRLLLNPLLFDDEIFEDDDDADFHIGPSY
jgi:predicted phage terminase large subunit-like protein